MNFENFAHAAMIELAKANGIGYRRWKNENGRSKSTLLEALAIAHGFYNVATQEEEYASKWLVYF